MMSKQHTDDIRKDLDFSISTGLHQKKILELLRNNLFEFTKEFLKYATPDSLEESYENYISSELSNFLNNKVSESGYILGFHASGPDLLVHQYPHRVHTSELFVVEAKRLRPESNQDYVKSGIGRFKKEEHGKGHEIAAMLGYVQAEDFEHWYNKVNKWITNLVSKPDSKPSWTTEDQISKVRVSEIGEYKSKHSRVVEDPITLHHFWISLCNCN